MIIYVTHVSRSIGSFDTDNGPYSQGSIVSLSSTFETTIPNGATIHGLSIFDNLIVHNGTFYLVTNNPTAFPAKANIARKPDRSGEWGERDPDEQVRAVNRHRGHLNSRVAGELGL